MNYTVTIGGVSCANRVIAIRRTHSLCNATATAEVELDPTWGQAFSPYDEIVIHEEGTKVFTGYVTPVQKQRMAPLGMVMAQCPTKKLQDWWLVDKFYSGGSTPAQVIAEICDDAGVSYSLNSATTETLPTGDDEVTWQYVSAWDVMEELLTMMGWQLVADADGVLQIGTISFGILPIHYFMEYDNLISVGRTRDDSYYRNAIAVYGSSGVSVKTSWVQAGELERAGAFANPLIHTESLASEIATRALREFYRNLDVKSCEIIGDPAVRVGDMAYVWESFTDLDGTFMVTTVRSSMDAKGYIMEVILDERCPVIWGYGVAPRLLYAATWGSGVYTSEDMGMTFIAANGSGGSTLAGEALYVNAIEVDCYDYRTAWAATRGGIYRTQNAGQTAWDYMDPGDLALYTGGSVSSGSVIWYDVDQDELHSERVYFVGADHNIQESWIVKYSSGSWANWNVRWPG